MDVIEVLLAAVLALVFALVFHIPRRLYHFYLKRTMEKPVVVEIMLGFLFGRIRKEIYGGQSDSRNSNTRSEDECCRECGGLTFNAKTIRFQNEDGGLISSYHERCITKSKGMVLDSERGKLLRVRNLWKIEKADVIQVPSAIFMSCIRCLDGVLWDAMLGIQVHPINLLDSSDDGRIVTDDQVRRVGWFLKYLGLKKMDLNQASSFSIAITHLAICRFPSGVVEFWAK